MIVTSSGAENNDMITFRESITCKILHTVKGSVGGAAASDARLGNLIDSSSNGKFIAVLLNNNQIGVISNQKIN